jgi:hypothetical protein
MACPICGDWKHVGTECPKKPAGWKPGQPVRRGVGGVVRVKTPEARSKAQPEAGNRQPPIPDQGRADVSTGVGVEPVPAKPDTAKARRKRRRAGQMIAPPGECAYCDRRRAAVIKAVKKYRKAQEGES